MDYRLAIENTPDEVPAGTGILLLHPSIVATDRIDTDFLKTDTDNFLVISTRTTAREVKQKLEHYDVTEDDAGDDRGRPVILDTLSVERGYFRRRTDDVRYASAPDDLDGILSLTESFLAEHDGKRRVSVDSLTEMSYYADEERVRDATERLLQLLDDHDAVGLFHLAKGVLDDDGESFADLFDAVIDIDRDGNVSSSF